MNKIVLEHYPASKLPDDLRGPIATDASVKVTIEEEKVWTRPGRDELLALMERARRNAGPLSLDDAAKRVRELRDEWD